MFIIFICFCFCVLLLFFAVDKIKLCKKSNSKYLKPVEWKVKKKTKRSRAHENSKNEKIENENENDGSHRFHLGLNPHFGDIHQLCVRSDAHQITLNCLFPIHFRYLRFEGWSAMCELR